MRFKVYYFDYEFSNSRPHIYCGKLKHNVSAAVSSGLPQVSLVYLSIEIIQPGKSLLKIDSWSNRAFKNYKELIQIMKRCVLSYHNKDEDNNPKNWNKKLLVFDRNTWNHLSVYKTDLENWLELLVFDRNSWNHLSVC